MFEKAKQLQWFEGFTSGSSWGIHISISCHLFADDTLVFYVTEKSKVLSLNLTLMIFEAMSGLHINMFKHIIYPGNIIPNLVELAGIMGCSTGQI